MKVINSLNLNPFASVRQITEPMMEQCVELSQKLLLTLRSARHRGWAHFLTGDESWFSRAIDHEQQWLPPGVERPTRPGKMLSSPKAMIVIFWSPLDFPVIQALSSEVTFTAEFFAENILPEIVAAKPASDTHRRLVLHMDNASPHRALVTSQNREEKGNRHGPHPAFSPDLAPSEFFLFGALKARLAGCTFESADELVEAIAEITGAIPRAQLEKVCLEWKERLQCCISLNGASAEQA
jgi:hypothetical protein